MSDEKTEARQGSVHGAADHIDVQDLKKHDPYHSEVLVDNDLMNDAYHGEDAEHQMGVWQAVKTYPWGCFWAFLMCFTIVSAAEGLQ